MTNDVSKICFIITTLFFTMLVMLNPAYADTAVSGLGTLDTVLQAIVGMITGNTAKLIATICVAIVGIGWMYGVIDLRKAAYCVLGIGIVFGASAFVTLLKGTTS
ncbi:MULTISPECIES: TrbC/VirB2 family protein [unclassified Bartonella]|uniref:TrbC/VirB2 family protein n=1 Tax=unclassified Bartonella TaxID=2645622 RepID=UPI00099A8FCC|nr:MULTISPECIES: TrbC/VirB2 family protein [unclassified Bartonella]AQX27872.1 type IV secretion system protein VirB2 [Bartonella sp. JB15]AQX27902.1 type IV secretion system protein VirB2 [Bartonella sp. JB15]AQX28661.1 type IV secretion system protein VirB2 [Bartonella sp. JB15]AQX29152.1 type IV secretion system protein VirB2 [Bartonella sp. JB63]AQX29182.1 type IV secretion system protein VirB2 [Bartonella sp. JB63]